MRLRYRVLFRPPSSYRAGGPSWTARDGDALQGASKNKVIRRWTCLIAAPGKNTMNQK